MNVGSLSPSLSGGGKKLHGAPPLGGAKNRKVCYGVPGDASQNKKTKKMHEYTAMNGKKREAMRDDQENKNCLHGGAGKR